MTPSLAGLLSARGRHLVAASCAIALTVIVAGGALAWRHAREQAAMAAEVVHIHRVLAALNQVEATMTDAETGQRGYLLTGEEEFLEPYLSAIGAARASVIHRPPIAQLLRELDGMDDAADRELLGRIRTLVEAKLAVLARTVALHRAGRTEEALALVREGQGKRFMDVLRTTLSSVRVGLRHRLDASEKARQAASDRALMTVALASSLSLLAIGLLLASTRHATRRIAASEERFRSLVEATASVVWCAGADGAVREDCSSWEAFTGQRRRQYQAYRWLAAVHRDDRRKLVESWRRAARAKAYWEVRARLRRRDEGYRDMMVRGVPLFDDHGEVREWIGICSDVSELVRAESQLRRFAESDLIGIVLASGDGRIEYANEEFRRIAGCGKDPDPANEGNCRRLAVDQAALSGSAGAPLRFETEFVQPDGARVPVMVGVTRPDPAHDRMIAFVLDQSAQKEVERALRRQQEEFRMLAENISQHAWTMDAEGRFLWFNQRWSEYTGLGEQTPLDEQWRIATAHPVHEERIRTSLAAALAEVRPWSETLPLRAASGDWQWFQASALPIRTSDASLRWFGTHTNVDERLRLEQELKDSNRRKDEFIATLAHELRNPLAPILAGVELMKMSTSLPPQLVRTRAIMDRQLSHLVRIIDDLLDVSRISTGKFELRLEPVNLKAVVDSALEVSRLHIEASRHALDLTLPAEALVVDGDAVRLAQVLGNLLNNAAKYTPDGGLIRLALEREGGEAVLRVCDNGIGIDADMLPHVFDLFAQSQHARGQRKGGIGIGLAIACRLVRMHGGHIEAASDGPGRGSCFTVRLPLAQPAAGQAAPGPAPRAASAGPRRIMILDDNVDAAETMAALLGMAGHEIRLAHTGKDAIALAHDFVPDIALLDIGLPDISGHEVARALRRDPLLAATRLVAMTGWGAQQDRQHSREAGFDRHLTKPVSLEALAETLPDLDLPAARLETE